MQDKISQRRIVIGAILSAVLGLQLGALGVVFETFLSRISDLPFATFLLLMQPIHLAIGVVEGLVTAAVVVFVWKAKPETLDITIASKPAGTPSFRKLLAGLVIAAAVTGGFISWFASTHPDGLEWSLSRSTAREELDPPKKGLYGWLATLQEETAFLPDYGFKGSKKEERRRVACRGSRHEPLRAPGRLFNPHHPDLDRRSPEEKEETACPALSPPSLTLAPWIRFPGRTRSSIAWTLESRCSRRWFSSCV